MSNNFFKIKLLWNNSGSQQNHLLQKKDVNDQMPLTIKLPRSITVFAIIVLLSFSASAQTTLTNDSIIKMSVAHLSVDVILNSIRTTPGNYSLGADDLIHLKKMGVADALIVAMQEQARNGTSTPANTQSPSSSNSQAEGWALRPLGDPMGKGANPVVATTITGQNGGVLEVIAECHNDLALSLNFSSKTPGLMFKRLAMAQQVVVNRPVNGIATGVARPTRYCANFRVQADDGPIGQASSQLCEDDTNAEILFPGDPAKLARASSSMLGDLIAPLAPQDHRQGFSEIGAMFQDLTVAMAQQTAPQMDALTGTLRMADIVKADSLAVKLTFTTGQQAVITLHPHDPVLGPYLAGCMSISPVPDHPVSSLYVVPRTPLPVVQAETNEQQQPNAADAPQSIIPTSADQVVMTKTASSVTGHAIITAPGPGLHGHNYVYIDTQDFTGGGTLDIQISIDRASKTDGSFNLFPSNAIIPTQGRLGNLPLAGQYDVQRGKVTHLRYRFNRGQIFKFALEGNWGSPQGATGQVTYDIRVSP